MIRVLRFADVNHPSRGTYSIKWHPVGVMSRRVWPSVAVVSLVGLLVGTFFAVHGQLASSPWRAAFITAALWAGFAVGAFSVMRSPLRLGVALILAGGIGLQVVAMSATPQMSDDFYRYIWDGKVQDAGISPYRYAPIDPALASIRDEYLFPPGKTCPEKGVEGACPLINRPTVHTIYPPVAEAYFFGMFELTPTSWGARSVQLGAALGAIATTIVLLMVTARRGVDPRRAVLWAWCPLVVMELGNNAHVDGLASLFVVAALGVISAKTLSRRGALLSGVLVGLAIATKLIPAIVMPSMVKRRPIAVVLAALAAVIAVYLPHVLTLGSATAGFLPGYLNEEKDGAFTVIKFLGLAAFAEPIALLILFGTALWAMFRTDPLAPWRTAAVVVGMTFLVTTPTYEWYALLLVPLVALGARASWLVLPLAMTFVYMSVGFPDVHQYLRPVAFIVAGASVAATALYARRTQPSRDRTVSV